MGDVIIALDFDAKDKALQFLKPFDTAYVKIGMELFYKEGPGIISEIKALGHKIFLDLKLHDIPNTVKKATLSLMALDVDMINFHVAGGGTMLKEAVQAARSVNPEVVLIGVTMLTSTDEATAHDDIKIDPTLTLKDTVAAYAQLAKDAGLDGVVCSALEVPSIKAHCGDTFLTVTPGIRPDKNQKDDQKRVVTPADARMLGSDYIVVGRPITQAEDPVGAYEKIKAEFGGIPS
ncbi:orotidine-5'-phosphate decarboxylase [Peptoniphilus equinus]|uniref:Orotidine 5'-phosphate decarboxylase n=1 Tax=Peptoniphilus equinus TaxID=3016343 RepID=A0ABY7QRS7_9FIRM|nr:orotidine-5'-phosphate decarboxylase [Peptoniphilus equinus]WBW49490.1 orotidine-5'-phosphate decarboxylase [Peptoniphilus equinus]